MSETPQKRLDLDWVKVVAGALAAVSSAALLSTLGAVGTVAGAALGSVIVSITSSLYSQGLARGTEKVAEAQTVALRKVGSATEQIQQVRPGDGVPDPDPDPGPAPDRGPAGGGGQTVGGPGDDAVQSTSDAEALAGAEEQLAEAAEELAQAADPAADGLTWRQRVLLLPWRRIGLAAGGLFVVAMVLVTAFEVVGGRSLSSYTEREGGDGGSDTSIGDLFDGGAPAPTDEDGGETPLDDPTLIPSPGGPASDRPEPSDDPTGDPTGPGGDAPAPDPDEPTDDTSGPPDQDGDEDETEPAPTGGTTTSTPAPTAPTPTGRGP